MLFGEIFGVALGAIRANKMRSFLTTLGVIIGIAAVIAMVALGEGAQRTVEERLQSMGTNVLTIRPGQQFQGGIDRGDTPLTQKDAEELLRDARSIVAVAPEMQRRQQVAHGSANANLEIVGSWPSYFSIQNHKMSSGRPFSAGEERGRRRVAVLGATVGERLGVASTESLIGQPISIRGIPFEVIGVLQSKGQQGWANPDESIYIPLATAQFRVFGSDRLRMINVQVASARQMDVAMAEIDRVLRRSHRIPAGNPADFSIRDQTALLSTFQETTRTFTYLLAGIAFVSLVVGGIGIMNIMLVSVTERTKEIGIRKALGARRRDILLQFLIEALVLCLAGGLIGLMLGIGGAVAMQRLAQWNTAVSPEVAMLAFLFAGGVGVFFGLWPARRAARLDPIIALRYE